MSRPGATSRLASVDGWRAVAVLGVMWWHAWIHTGNPAWRLSLGGHSLNLQRLGVILGNGVDFFFVLSGFCIWLSLHKHMPEFTFRGYGRFLLNRWQRLSPAFYFVCAITALVLAFAGHTITVTNLVAHAAWLFDVWPGAWQLSSPFWSLQVEWEFYLCLPLILLVPGIRARQCVLYALIPLSLAVSYYFRDTPNALPVAGTAHLPMHLSSFIFGIIVAEGWRTQAAWLRRTQGIGILLTGLLLAYLGRGLSSTDVTQQLGHWNVMAKTIGEPLMTFGFAVMLASTLTTVNGVNRILDSAPMQTLGRLSYSIYLWHWWPTLWIGHALIAQLGSTVLAHYLTLAAALLVSLPLAWITYTFFEKPYFSSGAHQRATAASASASSSRLS